MLDAVLGKHYWELGVATYPAYKDISARAIKKAKELNYKGEKYRSGKFATLLSRVVGWRAARALSYFKHGF